MKAAMKEKEAGKERLSVIRMTRAAIKNAEIERRKELSDDEIIQVLAKEVKQRKDSIPEYQKANREDIVAKLEKEIEILQEYLPQQLTEVELRAIITEIIAQTGAAGINDIGKVMGAVMPKVTGRSDGKLVNQLVRQLLA
jgi:uncharacterized protein YqeY